MAGNYDNTNRGALFPNKKKIDGDNRPNWTGKIDIDGKEYFISAWEKSDRNGVPYLSLARQTQLPGQNGQQPGGQQQGGYRQPSPGGRQQPPPPRQQYQKPADGQFNEDDIPF